MDARPLPEVGPSLRYVTAKPTKLRRGAAADVSQERRAAGQDRTRQTAMAGGGWSDDEPPF